MEKEVLGGIVHELPEDLKTKLLSDDKLLDIWQNLTPTMRNEWICWITSAKKQETREKRINWGAESLLDGKKRPCCWPGCSHR